MSDRRGYRHGAVGGGATIAASSETVAGRGERADGGKWRVVADEESGAQEHRHGGVIQLGRHTGRQQRIDRRRDADRVGVSVPEQRLHPAAVPLDREAPAIPAPSAKTPPLDGRPTRNSHGPVVSMPAGDSRAVKTDERHDHQRCKTDALWLGSFGGLVAARISRCTCSPVSMRAAVARRPVDRETIVRLPDDQDGGLHRAEEMQGNACSAQIETDARITVAGRTGDRRCNVFAGFYQSTFTPSCSWRAS